jgi:hypothetical protein
VIQNDYDLFNSLVRELPHLAFDLKNSTYCELLKRKEKLISLSNLTIKYLTTPDRDANYLTDGPMFTPDNFRDLSPVQAQGYLESMLDQVVDEISNKK